MNEEVKIKISQPMFEVGELERFDNNIHNIIEEYSKLMFKEKDQILTQRIIMKQEEEIERLKEEYIILQNASDEVEEEKDKEIEKLTFESTKWESKFYDEAKKVDRAIKYMEDNSKISLDNCVSIINFYRELLSILKGGIESD